jgi:tetratricopeptide (TPR) repeat protein
VLNHPVSLCLCGIYRVTFFLWTGDWSEADRIIDGLIAYAEKYSLRSHHAISLGLKGELSLRQGDTEAGLRLLNASVDALEAGQHQTMTPIFTSDLATCLARAGRLDEADAAINRAMGEPTRPHFYLPEIMRIKGELLASGPQWYEAENWFSRSLGLARDQSALAWELRAATSLAHLRARQGRADEAARVLRSVYDRFTEGFETFDLRAAKCLLDKLKEDCLAAVQMDCMSARGS